MISHLQVFGEKDSKKIMTLKKISKNFSKTFRHRLEKMIVNTFSYIIFFSNNKS